MKLIGLTLHIAEFTPFDIETEVVDATNSEELERAVSDAVGKIYLGATIKMSRFAGNWIIVHHGLNLGLAAWKLSFK